MSQSLYRELLSHLRKEQSPHRFKHSVSVGEFAAKLGKRHGWDPKRARLAGLLHDYAKEWSPKKLRKYAKKHKLDIPDKKFILKYAPNMFHAYVSAEVARHKKWITNKNDLDAIASHTLGDRKMGLEQKILFIADFAEPFREYRSAPHIRKLAMKDLNEGFREAVTRKLSWHLIKTKPIHPLPIEMWNRVVCKHLAS